MLIRFGFILCTHADGGWFRWRNNGRGISWTRGRPLFSERMGVRRPFARAFGYRFFRLEANGW